MVRAIFSSEKVFSNVRKELQIINPETGIPLEIDIWIPSLKIGFEFQVSKIKTE